MTVLESLPYALFCFAMVFVVLAVLCALIKLFSVGIALIEKKASPMSTETIPSVPAPAANKPQEISGGALRLTDVDEPTAAMIMAIVSDDSGIPLSELNFKSIKLIPEDKNDGR